VLRRRHTSARLAAAWLALALVTIGTVVVTTAQSAYADVGTSSYAIVTPSDAVSDVALSPSTVPQGFPTSFQLTFRATEALSGSQGGEVIVAFSAPLASAPSGVGLVDEAGKACIDVDAGGVRATTTSIVVDLVAACQVSAGDTVEVVFDADAPSSPGSFTATVTTSANGSAAYSNAVSVSASPPTFSASTTALGAASLYALTDASWTSEALSDDVGALVLTAKAVTGSALTWSGSASGYAVVSSSPVRGAVPDPVESVSVATTPSGDAAVTLVLGLPVLPGEAVSVTAPGLNPTVTSADQVSVLPEAGPPGQLSPVGQPEVSSDEVYFGTSVSAVSVVVSPPEAGAAATYSVSFEAAGNLEGGPGSAICLSEPSGPTGFSTETGVLVSDTTAGWSFVARAVGFFVPGPPGNPGCDAAENGAVVHVPSGDDIRAGDYVTVTLSGVTNPSAGPVWDFSVSTSADTVPAYAPVYCIGSATPTGVAVAVSPDTTGALATYTISGLVAAAARAAGASTVTLEGPAGTVFPDDPTEYTIEDSTMQWASGPAGGSLVGGGTNDVSFALPGAVGAGDRLGITVGDVVNPASANPAYTITLLGDVTGLPALAPFPKANLTFPNGAIVSYSGEDYVMAGGHGFAVGSASQLAALERVDGAEVQAAPPGAIPPSTPPRPGTLISTGAAGGSATVYVAGTDGLLHGFATPAQLVGDGYDLALVVTVPALAGAGIGATAGSEGQAADALATSADGAIVASAGTDYVFAGGRALPVPAGALGALGGADKAAVLSGLVSAAQQSATVANGAVLSAKGIVCVAYQGQLWPFRSEDQLVADGYGGTAAVAVPSLAAAGEPVVASYSGS